MTKLTKPVFRETQGALDGSFGTDRFKPLIAAMSLGDVFVIRPKGSRRPETLSIFDAYRSAADTSRTGAGKESRAQGQRATV